MNRGPLYVGLGTLVAYPKPPHALGADSLASLVRVLVPNAQSRGSRKLVAQSRHWAVMAPAALCQLITSFGLLGGDAGPVAPDHPRRLRVLVLGAEELDYFDEGAWYGALH